MSASMQNLAIVLFIGVVLVNIVSMALWSWLFNLVKGQDLLLGDETATQYTKYLFAQLMAGPFSPQTRRQTLGNPENDSIVRAVKTSTGYALISSITSVLRYFPLNFVPMTKQ